MVEIPENVRQSLDELTEAIRKSDIYTRYERCYQEIRKSPEIFELMDHFRRENFALNTRPGKGSGLEQEVRSMLLDRVSMYTNPLIGEYLDAELALCMLLRQIILELGSVAEFHLEAFSDLL